MEKITSKMFFRAWLEAVRNRKAILSKDWRHPRRFTPHVKGNDASILNEIAEKLNLLCYDCDYYFLDAVLYKQEDLVPRLPQGTYWLRNIRVAFEHENYVNSGLYKEVSHLLITNCDLRVLVTYPSDDVKGLLDYLGEIIHGNRQSKTISDDKSFLIIFGSETDFVWDGYVYKQDGWTLLTESARITKPT
jgi:hypothetical protein